MLFSLWVAGCTTDKNFNSRLDTIVKPYSFSIVGWELDNLFGNQERAGSEEAFKGESRNNPVTRYFMLVDRMKALESELQAIQTGNKTGDLVSVEKELAEVRSPTCLGISYEIR